MLHQSGRRLALTLSTPRFPFHGCTQASCCGPLSRLCCLRFWPRTEACSKPHTGPMATSGWTHAMCAQCCSGTPCTCATYGLEGKPLAQTPHHIRWPCEVALCLTSAGFVVLYAAQATYGLRYCPIGGVWRHQGASAQVGCDVTGIARARTYDCFPGPRRGCRAVHPGAVAVLLAWLTHSAESKEVVLTRCVTVIVALAQMWFKQFLDMIPVDEHWVHSTRIHDVGATCVCGPAVLGSCVLSC